MIADLSGVDKAAETKLIRTTFDGTIVLVEGGDDAKLFRKLLSRESCYFLPTVGKPILTEALHILNQDSLKGVLGIADADFTRIEGVSKVKNLVLCDGHDAETMIVMSEAFEEVVQEYGSEKKVDKFRNEQSVDDLCLWLVKQVDFFGRVRLVSARETLSLAFCSLDLLKVIDRRTLRCDIEDYVRRLLLISNPTKISGSDLAAKATAVKIDKKAIFELCCGDDLLALLAQALRHRWGSQTTT
ncbi:MAG: hypothetical protein ACRDGA_04390, partial [Bacteroidota bacterium]